MEPKKNCGAGGLAPAAAASTDHNSPYGREVPAVRRMSQRLRSSVDLRRRSTSRSTSSWESRSSTSISCVTRQASEDDCAKQRFIVWAAVKRNRSVRMAASERLRCPLLRCGEQFADHEGMLRHLSGCRHLEYGEYVCYECMKIEKFNDGKCKCCLGHPTKRRRIINAAKSFFSTLGHKSRRDGSSLDLDLDEFVIPPPSYDSLSIEHQSQLPPGQEISGNEILELDAHPAVPAELDSVSYEPQPAGAAQPSEGVSDSFFASIPQFVTPAPPAHSLQRMQNNNGSRPSLALDTHNIARPRKVPRTKYLSPSSSLRSTDSSQGVISPISAGSGIWTSASAVDTTLASPITPFSSDGIQSGTVSRENSCKFPKDYPLPSSLGWNNVCDKADMPENSGLSDRDNYTLGNISELPGDCPLDPSIPRVWGEDPLLFSFEPKDNYSWSSTVDTEVNVLFTSDNMNLNVPDDVLGCDSKTLVGHTWVALKEHMACSIPNVKAVNNPLARQLEALSAKEVALRGLASLKSMINGIDPTDPLDYLCFVHVAYAFSVIIHEEELSTRCFKHFKQALAYQGFLPAADRAAYSAVVAAIWEPRDLDNSDSNSSRSSGLKGKEPELRLNQNTPLGADALVGVAQNFLDDLEMSVVCGGSDNRPLEVISSDLWSTHITETGPNPQSSNAFPVTVSYIAQVLNQSFGPISDNIGQRLRTINQRATNGVISSVRRLELEILQAGKASLTTEELFDDFIPQVRALCDPIYAQREFHSRTKYHILGVALVESLIQAMDGTTSTPVVSSGPSCPPQGEQEFSINTSDSPDPLDEFFKDLDRSFDRNFPNDYNISMDPMSEPLVPNTVMLQPSAQPSIVDQRPIVSAQSHSTVDPSSLSQTGSETQLAAAVSKSKSSTLASEPNASEDANSSAEASSSAQQQQKVEANSCCEICGYRPKGDPQWFKGSMAKHKKLQHSTDPPKIYKCPFPGCTSAYKNRPDNLRQHQIEKGHFVDGVDERGRRPGKRKKMDDDE